jgi:L-ribulose-5-phosphate 3-epimerase
MWGCACQWSCRFMAEFAMPVGLYEKALPVGSSWEERLVSAAKAGYDFIDISIDESAMRLARLD